jgi:amidohydrolase
MVEALYGQVDAELDRLAERLWEVSLALHAQPELAFEERVAAELLSHELEDGGFRVERGIAGLPTAFAGTVGEGGRPRIALLLEYDALPGLGHACGHNLIAAAGLGAALAVRTAFDDLPGTLLVVGTPAEEGGGGKVVELEAGVFEEVDAALMFHPGVHSWSWAPLTAQVEVRVAFHGQAAHPTGNPADGIDAVAAVVQLFTALTSLQKRLPEASHIQGVITSGGEATNIIPDFAEARFGLRGRTTAALDELVGELRTCAQGVATATGTTVDVERLRPFSGQRSAFPPVRRPPRPARHPRHPARTGCISGFFGHRQPQCPAPRHPPFRRHHLPGVLRPHARVRCRVGEPPGQERDARRRWGIGEDHHRLAVPAFSGFASMGVLPRTGA